MGDRYYFNGNKPVLHFLSLSSEYFGFSECLSLENMIRLIISVVHFGQIKELRVIRKKQAVITDDFAPSNCKELVTISFVCS